MCVNTTDSLASIPIFRSTDVNDEVNINWAGAGVGEMFFYSPRIKEYPLDK